MKKNSHETFDITTQPYYKYAEGCVNGEIVVGELTRLACHRFLRDLQRDDLVFRFDKVNKFGQFVELFKQFEGRGAGKNFKLLDWEWFFFANILGWYWKETNLRRFQNVYLCISRKQGKSAICSLLTLWALVGDGEAAPQVALAANSRDQARQLYRFVKEWAEQIDPQGKTLKILRNGIECDANKGKLTVFAADHTRLDGANLHFYAIDEYGGAKDSTVYDVCRSSQAQREQPLGCILSTAGFFLDGPMKKQYDMYCDILHGIKKDDTSFGLIYALDEKDSYEDPAVWPKIAPSLGTTMEAKFIEDQIVYAKNNPSAEVGVLTKTFNMWCSSATTWIPDNYVRAVMAPVNLEDFDPRSTTLFVGQDLAATGDLSCTTILITNSKDPKIYLKNFYYLPESALETSPNRDMYRYWARTGQLTLTSGNVQDYDYILNDILKIRKKYTIRAIGYDPWNSSSYIIGCTQNGLPMTPISQSLANLNRPTKELERLIMMGTDIVIDSNEVTLFCYHNATPKFDALDNVRITKTSYELKIDGVISQIIALCSYLDTPRFRGGISSV